MLSDEAIEHALDYLRDNAHGAAKARAERIYIEEYRKSLKAQIMQEHALSALGTQERNAYADKRYIAHLQALRDAVEADEKHRFLFAAAEAKISAWQTKCANERAVKI